MMLLYFLKGSFSMKSKKTFRQNCVSYNKYFIIKCGFRNKRKIEGICMIKQKHADHYSYRYAPLLLYIECPNLCFPRNKIGINLWFFICTLSQLLFGKKAKSRLDGSGRAAPTPIIVAWCSKMMTINGE